MNKRQQEFTVVGRCGVVWSVSAECKSPHGRMTYAVAPLAAGQWLCCTATIHQRRDWDLA
jgi:hypothetical protein